MHYRNLGNTGITVSEIGFGTNTISGMGSHGRVAEADGVAAVERAYDLGITFFDTAESYSGGRSEEVLGKVLGDKHDVVICSKVTARDGAYTVEGVRRSVEGSLRRLRRGAIDVYLLHGPTTGQIGDEAVTDALDALQRDGLIRSYGLSTRGTLHLEQGPAALRAGRYASMELPMNITQQEAEDALLPEAAQQGMGIVIRVPLGSGLLTGKYDSLDDFPEGDHRGQADFRERMERRLAAAQPLRDLAREEGVSVVHAALAWVLSHSEVSVAIPGCKNAAQVEDNAAASDVTLSATFLDRVRALSTA